MENDDEIFDDCESCGKVYGVYLELHDEAVESILLADRERQICIRYQEKNYNFLLAEFLCKLNIGE